jgi:hypothetical protein
MGGAPVGGDLDRALAVRHIVVDLDGTGFDIGRGLVGRGFPAPV